MNSTAKKTLATLIVLCPFVIFLFLRLNLIFQDMSNSDAVRWHTRSSDFAHALKTEDFANTYQSYHPGVTLMWLSSGVEVGLKLQAKLQHTEYKSMENTDGYYWLDGISKIVLVGILFILLILQYKFISALFDPLVANLYVYLMAIEPYLIGINRWYHLTSLEVFLTFTSFLAFLIWADLRIRKYIILSGMLFGLALLTKFSSLIVLPVFAAVYFITLIKDKNRILTNYLSDIFVFIVLACGLFVILFPAMWINPIAVLANLLTAGQNAAGGQYSSVIYAEVNPYLYYLVVLIYKLSPITLVLFALGLVKSFVWRERLTTYTILYIVTSLSLLVYSEQKIERYIIAFVPAIILICAVTLSRMERSLLVITLIISIFFTTFVYAYFNPLYSGYYSPLFGGPKEAYALGIYDDSGEFYQQAAIYLNQKGRDTVVTVPNNINSFGPYYKGKLSSDQYEGLNYFVDNKDSRRKPTDVVPNCDKVERRFFNYNLDAVTIYLCHPYDFE